MATPTPTTAPDTAHRPREEGGRASGAIQQTMLRGARSSHPERGALREQVNFHELPRPSTGDWYRRTSPAGPGSSTARGLTY